MSAGAHSGALMSQDEKLDAILARLGELELPLPPGVELVEAAYQPYLRLPARWGPPILLRAFTVGGHLELAFHDTHGNIIKTLRLQVTTAAAAAA